MREGLTSPAGSFAEGRAFTFPLGHGAESFYPCIYGEPGSKEPQVRLITDKGTGKSRPLTL